MTDVHIAKVLFKDRDTLRSFHVGEERSFPVIAALYLVAFGGLILVWAATQLPLVSAISVWLIAFVVIGWAQYSLGNGLHEAVHHNLRNRKNDWFASLLTAYPVGLTISYREFHLKHHRYLGTERDPEFRIYTHFPPTKVALVLRFFWFVSGIPAILQFLDQQHRAVSTARLSYFDSLAFIGVQIILLTCFWWIYGNPLFYFVFWVLPIATVGKLLSTTRLLCEHGSPTRDWVVRTIDGSRWQTWLMGAFDFNYHGEHHLFPSIPYAQLHRLHQLHRAYLEKHAEYRPLDGRYELFRGGYLALIAYWFRILPWHKPAATTVDKVADDVVISDRS